MVTIVLVTGSFPKWPRRPYYTLRIIRNFEKRKVNSLFTDNIWGVDLDDMQLISIFNKGICFLLCVIDIFSKYAWVISIKDKKGTTITNAFQ